MCNDVLMVPSFLIEYTQANKNSTEKWQNSRQVKMITTEKL